MPKIPHPTPTCTRFQAATEMPCIKCGTLMRLVLLEPWKPNFDLLNYQCIACDAGESFLNRTMHSVVRRNQ
jgi:hypothetical protein